MENKMVNIVNSILLNWKPKSKLRIISNCDF